MTDYPADVMAWPGAPPIAELIGDCQGSFAGERGPGINPWNPNGQIMFKGKTFHCTTHDNPMACWSHLRVVAGNEDIIPERPLSRVTNQLKAMYAPTPDARNPG